MPPPVNAFSLTLVGRLSGGGGGQGQGGVKRERWRERGRERQGKKRMKEQKKKKRPPHTLYSSIPQLIHCLRVVFLNPPSNTVTAIVGSPEMARNLLSTPPSCCLNIGGEILPLPERQMRVNGTVSAIFTQPYRLLFVVKGTLGLTLKLESNNVHLSIADVTRGIFLFFYFVSQILILSCLRLLAGRAFQLNRRIK